MSANQAVVDAKNLSCDECRDLLSGYVDRELTGGERASIENHLRTCTKCGTESTRIHGLKRVMNQWDGVQGSNSFREKVMTQMVRESQQIPSKQFTDAADKAASQKAEAQTDETAKQGVNPLWIVIGFVVLAAAAYFTVLKLRGM